MVSPELVPRTVVSPELHFVIFEAQDNGVGMDVETKEKLFTLFYSSKGTEGTGLGLFVASKIIKQHGGRVQVESEEKKGTKFIIEIPRKRVVKNIEQETEPEKPEEKKIKAVEG